MSDEDARAAVLAGVAATLTIADRLAVVIVRAQLAPLLERWEAGARNPWAASVAATPQQAYAECARELRTWMETVK